MKSTHRLVLALSATLSLGLAAQAHAEGVKVGVLTCHVSSGWGLIFGSSKDLNCTFSPQPDRVENYEGKINKFGVDIGYQKGGVMAWAVIAPSANVERGALAGSYGGVTAGASAGVGAGANVLVGGSNKSISLQPVSIEGMAGLNVAAGIGGINLTYKP